MKVAPALLQDAAAIAALHVRSWQSAYADILAPAFLASLSVDDRAQRWRQILETSASQTRVAVDDDGSIHGFVSLGPHRDLPDRPAQGEIWALYVAPERWGQGVGGALLSHALRELRALGLVDVSLWVLAGNQRAIRFYESQGFARMPGSNRTIALGGREVEEIAYALRPNARGGARSHQLLEEMAMFDHIGLGVSDLAASKAFFLQALEPLGVAVAMEGPYGVGLGQHGKPSLWLHQGTDRPAPLHLAFVAAHRAQVDAFHLAALAAGGKDNGAPGLRPHYHPHYYGAFVIGPDGHNVEAVCHKAEPGA